MYRASDTIDGAKAAAMALVSKRQLPLVSVCQLHHVRIAAVEERESRLYQVITPAGLITDTRDVSAVGTLVDLRAAGGSHREYLMHGRADKSQSWDAAGNEDLGLGGPITTYLDYLKDAGNGWMLRALTQRVTAAGLPPITSVAVVAGEALFTVALPGVVPGDTIIVSSMKGYKVSQFLGKWSVRANVGGVVTCKRKGNLDPDFFYDLGGKVRVGGTAAYTFKQISDWDNARAGTRKIGRSSR